MELLKSVKNFRGLNSLTKEQIDLLCADIRELIIKVTLENGGHLASSLGSVELTIALLKVFNPDSDKIIFDVGHQAYTYKILTDRLDAFNSMRTKGGIAGFPRMDESPYDFFTTGHSSTSISAAMGYAKARDIRQEDYNVVAVIGDGALINGVAFEALNCIESTNSKVIIILNDNKMSINCRVGGMAGHLARLAVNPTYKKFKDFIKDRCRIMKSGESLETALGLIKTKLKSLLLPTNIFEEMGISYWGPFDGHNVQKLEVAFELAKNYDKSLVIHVITKKGKGSKVAEEYPDYYHGIGPNSKLISPELLSESANITWSAAMERCLNRLAGKDPRVVVCTAAMKDGTKLNNFAETYPNRFFDVGISEEHLLIFAAGMAAAGMRPAVCIYSTFLQRAADQVVHDVCLSKLPVLLGIDRAGFVGADGETHHGLLDVAWLRSVPEMTLVAPRDIEDLNFFVNNWIERGIPLALRYSRGDAPQSISSGISRKVAEWGKAEILIKGKDFCLIGIGSTLPLMLEASELLKNSNNIEVTVVDLRFIKPIDFVTLKEVFEKHKLIITAEESFLTGGIGEAIASFANKNGCPCKVISVGVPDRFISHATRKQQWEECELTSQNIVAMCLDYED